jgi:hypothetical protein
MPAVTESVIVLRGGLTVPLGALQVLWDLEARGFDISEDAGMLVVAPKSRITADDDQAIREHRDELLTLVKYSEDIQ